MGRIDDDTSSSQHHQGLEFRKLHQNPAFAGDAPPPPHDEDLYEPPADYKPPPPPQQQQNDGDDEIFKTQAFPPRPPPQQQHSGGDDDDDIMKTQAFPPRNDVGVEPVRHAFPPHQPQTVQFPPPHHEFNPLPNQNQNFPINHNVGSAPPPRINQHVQGSAPPPPIIPQQNLLQLNQPWKTNLFDCMENPENAIITFLFPCVTFGQIAEILDNGATSCATSGILYSLITFCIAMPCLMTFGYRSKLRARFGLVEAPAPDCLLHCFCGFCALCQEYRELQHRGIDPAIGFAGNVARMQQQLRMNPPMQQRMI